MNFPLWWSTCIWSLGLYTSVDLFSHSWSTVPSNEDSVWPSSSYTFWEALLIIIPALTLFSTICSISPSLHFESLICLQGMLLINSMLQLWNPHINCKQLEGSFSAILIRWFITKIAVLGWVPWIFICCVMSLTSLFAKTMNICPFLFLPLL